MNADQKDIRKYWWKSVTSVEIRVPERFVSQCEDLQVRLDLGQQPLFGHVADNGFDKLPALE
jgi:hypothetical protein